MHDRKIETRLMIGMAGVVLSTLLALIAPVAADPSACPPTIGGAGCERFSAAAPARPRG